MRIHLNLTVPAAPATVTVTRARVGRPRPHVSSSYKLSGPSPVQTLPGDGTLPVTDPVSPDADW